MRKIKLAKGVWAFLRHDAYPYLIGGEVADIKGVGVDKMVHFTASVPYHHAPVDEVAFCVKAGDEREVLLEIGRLAAKHEQAMATMTKVLGDQRRRSLLGQLDPRA